MSYVQETRLIEQHFFNNWDADTTPVQFDNSYVWLDNNGAAYKNENQLDEWLRFIVDFSNSQQKSFGAANNFVQRNGLVTVQVFVPENEGSGRAFEIVEAISAIFELADIGEVDFAAANYTRVGVDSRWFQVNVNIPFLYYS